MAKRKNGQKGRGPSFQDLIIGKEAQIAMQQAKQRAFINKFDKMRQGIDGCCMPKKYSSFIAFIDEAVDAGIVKGRQEIAVMILPKIKLFRNMNVSQLQMRLWNEQHERIYGEEGLMQDALITCVERIRQELQTLKEVGTYPHANQGAPKSKKGKGRKPRISG